MTDGNSDSAGLEPADTSNTVVVPVGRGGAERIRLLRAAAQALFAEYEDGAAEAVQDALGRIIANQAPSPPG